MRSNLPVTQVEIALSDQFAIVSTTDLQGHITYANPYFVEISGFSAQELLVAPQNILRHPDMPVDAFADLWRTVQSGQPWTSTVKNRTKNGDFYWVQAHVTPVYENGQAVGYMSVRTKPGREQVERASAIYKEIREGNPRKLRIVNGEVVLGRWQGLLAVSPLKRLQHSLMLVMIVMALLGLNLVAPHVVPAALSSWLAVLAGLGVALTAHASMTLQRKIRQPLKNATAHARIMAGGDLTQAVVASGSDEFGQLQGALRQMNINLRSIIGDVRSDFENLKRATQEISTGNRDLAKRTESQAASLEEISASMTMLTAAVQQSAVNAAYADELAHGACLIVQQSGQIVSQTVTTMQDVTTASHQIVDIISLIDGIAFQTNILALNAAVEAARAGEQGRGFAVVAAEVRSLAARSASAAKDIKRLIATTVSQVDAGMKLSCEAGNSMHQAIESVEKVTQIMTEITHATCIQGANIGQISEAVRHLDDVTRKNLALVKDAAAATTDLSEQTDRLTCAIAIFKTSGDQGGAVAPAKRPLA